MKKFTLITGSLAFAIGLITSAYGGTDMKEITTPPEKPANWYIGVFGGATFSQDYYGGSSNFHGTSATSSISNDVGGLGGLKIGYKFMPYNLGGGFALEPALEGEFAYIDAITPPAITAQSVSMKADLNSVSFGVNGIARLKTGTIFTPYLGVGIGGQWMQLSSVNFTTTTTISPPTVTTTTHTRASDKDDVVFSFQGLAGFDIEVAHNWDIFTEYKYLVALDPSFTFSNAGGTGAGYTYKDDFLGQSLITAGLKYNF